MDMDAKAWLNITTDTASDTAKWFERDLDDFLKEIHRENDEVDPAKLEEEEGRSKLARILPKGTQLQQIRVLREQRPAIETERAPEANRLRS